MVETDAHTQLVSECVGVCCAVELRKNPALASVADILRLLDRHKVEFIKNDNPPPSAELEFKSDPPMSLWSADYKRKSLGFAELLSAGVSFSLDPLISASKSMCCTHAYVTRHSLIWYGCALSPVVIGASTFLCRLVRVSLSGWIDCVSLLMMQREDTKSLFWITWLLNPHIWSSRTVFSLSGCQVSVNLK